MSPNLAGSDDVGVFRSLWAMVRLTFGADPMRTVVSILPVMTIAGMLPAYLTKRAVDAIGTGDRSTVAWCGAGVGTAIAVAMILSLTQFRISMRLRESVSLELDRRLIQQSADIATIEHFERSAYADRMELLRTHRDSLIGGTIALSQSSQLVFSLATTLFLLATIHPLLLLLPIAGIPTLVIAARSQRLIEDAYQETAQDDRRALHLFDLATASSTAKELRVFGLEQSIGDRYNETWVEVDRRRNAAWMRANLVRGGASLFFASSFVAAMALAVFEASRGRATPGDVLMTVSLAMTVNGSVEGTAQTVSSALNVGRSMARYLWLVDHAAAVSKATAPRRTVPVPERIDEGIRLEDVGFTYPAGTAPVLSDVDLFLPAGATVALVGVNGAGKSTLVKLLCRFYDPTEGRITVDGVDLRDIPVEEWRARMAAGFQDFARFEVAAHENVGVGDLSRLGDRDAAAAALERAAASDLVDALPGGLDTVLGADGAELSGGQWQKLALGRALMRHGPLLLVLDEPTAAIDAETEHNLFERYASAARETAAETGGITVLVSHRFSTVRMADLIVVIDNGHVAESGTHAELMAKPAAYAELYELQARAYR